MLFERFFPELSEKLSRETISGLALIFGEQRAHKSDQIGFTVLPLLQEHFISTFQGKDAKIID